jgi:hypothetical protein
MEKKSTEQVGEAVSPEFSGCLVRILAGTAAILTEVFSGLPYSCQENSWILPRFNPPPLPSKYFPINHSTIRYYIVYMLSD